MFINAKQSSGSGNVPGCSLCPMPAAQSAEMQHLSHFAFSRGYSRGDGAPETCLSLAEAAAVQDGTSDIGRREKGAEMLSGCCVLPVHTAEEAHSFRMTLITSKTLPWCFSCSRPAPGCVEVDA